MSKHKSILTQVKTLLGMDVKLMQATLDNGTVIEAESWEAGEPVFIVTEDGLVPLPEGTYTTEDGTSIVVAEEGIIAEVTNGEAAAEEAEEEAPEEMGEQPKYVTQEQLEAAINTIVERLSAQKPAEKPQEKAAEKPAELSSDKPMPAAKPIKHNPERDSDKKKLKLYAQSALKTTEDVVMSKIFSIKKK